jgi:hypothetical protein
MEYRFTFFRDTVLYFFTNISCQKITTGIPHGPVKVTHETLSLSFPQAKRTGNPSENNGKDSGQAGMTSKDDEFMEIFLCRQVRSQENAMTLRHSTTNLIFFQDYGLIRDTIFENRCSMCIQEEFFNGE